MPADHSLGMDPTLPPLAPACTSINCGRETTPARHPFPPRRIAGAALIATEHGHASAVVNGRAIRHRPRTLLAIAPHFDLLERSADAGPWTAMWCVFAGPWATALGAHLARHEGGVLVLDPAPRAWLGRFADMLDLLAQPGQGREWQAMARLGDLLGLVAGEAGRAEAVGASVAQRLDALVDELPERAWSLTAAAAELGLPRSVLARRFAAETGEPPARFLRRRRCEHARLLLERGLGVGQVAERLGFPDQFQFSRCYRTVMGAPPSLARGRGGLRG